MENAFLSTEETCDVVNYPNVLFTGDIRVRTIEKSFVVVILVSMLVAKRVSIESEARVYMQRVIFNQRSN